SAVTWRADASRAISSSATIVSTMRRRASYSSRPRPRYRAGSVRRHSRSTSASVITRSPTFAAGSLLAAVNAVAAESASELGTGDWGVGDWGLGTGGCGLAVLL